MGFYEEQIDEVVEAVEPSDSSKQKPDWMKCVLVTSLLLAITLSSIAVGILVGYTFCYIENHTASLLPGKVTHLHHVQIANFPSRSFDLGAENRTINGASGVLIAKLLSAPGHMLYEGPGSFLIPTSKQEGGCD